MQTCELCGKEFEMMYNSTTRKYCYECSPYYKKGDKAGYVHRQIEFRKAMKRFGIQFLGRKCQRCGYDKCNAALQFHHKDPELKEYNFNDSTMSVERYKEELKKCILLCANCHAELHWNESSDNK